MEQVIAWFDAYRIAHKVEWENGRPVRVSPLGKLVAAKTGHHWRVNGRVVSRKFVKVLEAYYG